MHRPRGRSVSQMQDTEIPNIEGHHEYVNKVLKWSISDLDRFIQLLRARVSAEEAYIASLAKISKTQAAMENEPFNCFGDAETTFRKATLQYELSINQLITIRQNLVRSMNAKIKMLSQVKEAQENRRKVVKMRLNERNSRYISYRTRDIVKLQRTYWHKCTELQVVQQQLHQQQAHQQQQASNDAESREGDAVGRLSVEEPRPRLSSDSGRDSDSISSLNNDTTLKKGMANLMAQMRTQLANATAAAAVQDMMKQNAKCARISNEIITADMEYRDGIRTLEKYRREQIEEADLALEQIEVVFRDKTNATQTALREVLISERTALAEENRLLDHSAGMVEMMDGKRDISLFNNEYRKRGFIKPSRIYYKNFYHGECKDLLFGTSLEAYAAEHNRTVPLVVSKCIEAVERMGGLQKEGIYRISGRQSNVDILKYAFEQNEQGIDLEKLKFDVVTIASVLKIYLRELKEPLFSLSVNSRMEYATLDKQRRLGALANKLSSIPKSHRDTLYVLVRHLAQVNEHSEVNKMNMQNLSVVFTPAIFHDHNNAEVPGEWRCDSVFEDLITHHKTLFISAENKPKQSTSRPPPGPTPITIPSSTSLNTSGGMLLTAPLHPSSLGASPEPSASSGYENTYPTSWKDGTPRPPPPNASALHRSVSLTPNRRNIQPSPFQPPPLQPSPLRTASSKHQLEIDTSNKQQPPQIPPLPELTSQQQTPSSAPSNTTTDENQASVASTLIGMAALSGAIDDTMIGGGLRGLNQHTEQSPVTSPTDEFQSKRTSKGVIPPRQDSLRQQLAHQQMMGGPPPPIITTTPIPKPSRPSPSGPQTPTLSTTADHVPFSAQIITTNDDNGNSSNKQTEEKQQLPSTAELSSTQS